jgi:hypothetical protein
MHHPATPPNAEVFLNAQDSKRNTLQISRPYVELEESPIPARYGKLDIQHSDNKCDAEMDDFVPKTLGASEHQLLVLTRLLQILGQFKSVISCWGPCAV